MIPSRKTSVRKVDFPKYTTRRNGDRKVWLEYHHRSALVGTRLSARTILSQLDARVVGT